MLQNAPNNSKMYYTTGTHGDIDVFYTYTNSHEFRFSALNVQLTSTHCHFPLRLHLTTTGEEMVGIMVRSTLYFVYISVLEKSHQKIGILPARIFCSAIRQPTSWRLHLARHPLPPGNAKQTWGVDGPGRNSAFIDTVYIFFWMQIDYHKDRLAKYDIDNLRKKFYYCPPRLFWPIFYK